MLMRQSPPDHLKQHALTAEMLRRGVTPVQLDAIGFRTSNRGWPFDQWSFRFPTELPHDAIPLVKAYCALKWVVLEDPPATRDRDDAWNLIQSALTAPLVVKALAAHEAQRANGKLGVAIRRIYSDADRARWNGLATEPDIARHASKRRRAELIAQREGLERAAVETIRKVI